MIRILLVDDQALLCEVLKTWLEVEEDFQVLDIAHSGEDALTKVEMLQPDIVLMDINMPGMTGLEATSIISERFPQVKVIFLSGHDEETYLRDALKSGAKGYLFKNTTAEQLAHKIRSVYYEPNTLLSESDEALAAIKTELEELLQTYRAKFQQQLKELNSVKEAATNYEPSLRELKTLIVDKYEPRLTQLEAIAQSSWESVRGEIIDVQRQFGEANHSLSSQLNQQVVNLKKELDFQLAHALEDWFRQRVALQEWAVQRDEMRPSWEEFESKYRHDLMSAINPLRASVREMDRQMRVMRRGLISAVLTAVMALSFASILLVSDLFANSNEPSVERTEQTGR
jgi:YesN/AraC family two-component response regulator